MSFLSATLGRTMDQLGFNQFGLGNQLGLICSLNDGDER